MSLDTVVQAILEKGKGEAEQILEEARAERERMLAEVRAEGQGAIVDADVRARHAAERRRVQELARAELEARKIVLAAQREALERAYRTALERLGDLPESPDFLRRLLAANAAEWKAGGRVYSNARDEAVVRKIVGDRYAGNVGCAGGVVIESADDTRRIDLRYESILREIWDDAVKEVAEALWPSTRP